MKSSMGLRCNGKIRCFGEGTNNVGAADITLVPAVIRSQSSLIEPRSTYSTGRSGCQAIIPLLSWLGHTGPVAFRNLRIKTLP